MISPSKDFIGRLSRSFALIAILLLSLLLLWHEGFAEEKPYIVGTGDVLSVKIFAGGTTQEALELTVSSKGTINFPFLGEIKAAGLSITQLTEVVTRPLRQDYFVDPQVIISIRDYRSKKVYITGAIEKPGLYPLEGPTSLLEVLARAGGVTKERGNLAFILKASLKELKENKEIDQLVHQKQAVQVNLRELLDQGIMARNIELEADDVVYIQPASLSDLTRYKIYVLGKVEKPGVYDFQEGLTALDACTLAGGFAKYAAPNRTVITRREPGDSQQTININLDKVRKGDEKDVLLKPGDRIYVPESWF